MKKLIAVGMFIGLGLCFSPSNCFAEDNTTLVSCQNNQCTNQSMLEEITVVANINDPLLVWTSGPDGLNEMAYILIAMDNNTGIISGSAGLKNGSKMTFNSKGTYTITSYTGETSNPSAQTINATALAALNSGKAKCTGTGCEKN